MSQTRLFLGDCLDALRQLPDASVDAVVTDPPYGLSFMGKKWDYDVPSVEVWAECLRVLKPGGHLLAFAGTRTQHRMAVRIEDAGFEIRDMIAWVYGSGFPKSLDVSKAIDRAAGAEREFMPVGSSVKRLIPGAEQDKTGSWIKDDGRIYQPGVSAPATDAARQWQGWGTALKPALEPVTVARKPLTGTVAENVQTYGTGALNIDGCRMATDPAVDDPRLGGAGTWSTAKMAKNVYAGGFAGERHGSSQLGRWPANLIHDVGDEAAGLLGEAARFFYSPKADGTDRNEGLDGMEAKLSMRYGEQGQGPSAQQTPRKPVEQRNIHPTVKPTDLMQYLCRLVTPPGGTVLDPFMGSGSTGKAAQMEGFRFIGCERDPEYFAIAKARIETAHGSLFASIADIEVNAA
ncbi:MAG: site-specific DNA-methyltransferase [Phenylobacterium sp.]|nr:site-specific DNA-methyltransferase [Phenylobacterium sp.]